MKVEACKLALRQLFRSDAYFNISTIDNLLKLTNTIPDPEIYDTLKLLHCIYYKDMKPEFREELFDTVLKMFDGSGFEFSAIDILTTEVSETMDREKIGFFKKILG